MRTTFHVAIDGSGTALGVVHAQDPSRAGHSQDDDLEENEKGHENHHHDVWDNHGR
mgnify:CR=1 FL=1